MIYPWLISPILRLLRHAQRIAGCEDCQRDPSSPSYAFALLVCEIREARVYESTGWSWWENLHPHFAGHQFVYFGDYGGVWRLGTRMRPVVDNQQGTHPQDGVALPEDETP